MENETWNSSRRLKRNVAVKSGDVGKSNQMEHNTSDRTPIKQLPGCIPTQQRDIINQQLNDLQANDRFQ